VGATRRVVRFSRRAPKLLLQMHDVLAGHRRRHLHALGRADEAAHFDDVAKHFHADEGIHGNRS